MTPVPAAGLSEVGTAFCLAMILLVPLAALGLCLMNTGLGRSRSAAHTMLTALCITATAALVYFFCGFSWQGAAGRAAHVFTVAGKPWNWIAAEPMFFRGLPLDGSGSDSGASLAALLQMFSVGLAALIPLGAGTDRWRMAPACVSSALMAGLSYPLFAHWAWGGGWLAQLGLHYGLGRGYVDAGGAGCIQVAGGLAALSIAWILGPRRGKYAASGMAAAIPGHHTVFVLLSCFLALMGWFGLNASGAMLFAGAAPGEVVLIAVNTMLSAGLATLAAALITRARFGRPDASLCANGWVGGLVASSAGCVFMPPAVAALTGLVAGALVTLSVEWIDLYLAVDDPGGSISVHAVAGVWGLLALGMFGRIPAGRVLNGVGSGAGDSGQWLAQLVGVATLFGCVLPLTYSLNWLLNRFLPQRVSAEGEWQGMDLTELGAGAYPEFVIHREDFIQR